MGWTSPAAIEVDLSGAEEAYRASLAIRERLAAADPTNTEWQRDLSVSHYRLAHVANAAGRASEEREHLVRCREVLRGMRERGMHLDPPIAQLLEQLERLG